MWAQTRMRTARVLERRDGRLGNPYRTGQKNWKQFQEVSRAPRASGRGSQGRATVFPEVANSVNQEGKA